MPIGKPSIFGEVTHGIGHGRIQMMRRVVVSLERNGAHENDKNGNRILFLKRKKRQQRILMKPVIGNRLLFYPGRTVLRFFSGLMGIFRHPRRCVGTLDV